MKSKAEEMFKKCGFRRITKSYFKDVQEHLDKNIVWEKAKRGYLPKTVEFLLDEKIVDFRGDNCNYSKRYEAKEIEAILQQCKELRWL